MAACGLWWPVCRRTLVSRLGGRQVRPCNEIGARWIAEAARVAACDAHDGGLLLLAFKTYASTFRELWAFLLVGSEGPGAQNGVIPRS